MKKKRNSSCLFFAFLLSSFCFAQGLKEDQFAIARTIGAIWRYVDAEPNDKIEYRLFACGEKRVCRVRLHEIDLFLISRSEKKPFVLTTLKAVKEDAGYLLINGDRYKLVTEWKGSQPIYE